MSAGTVRDESRLEVDDPTHCKECGAELPTGDLTVYDDEGRPENWREDGAGWETIEICPHCWAEEKIKELRQECSARYCGELPGVLARD